MEDHQNVQEEPGVVACRSFTVFCDGRGLNSFNPRQLRGIFEKLRLSPGQVLEDLGSEVKGVELWQKVPNDSRPSLNSMQH